LSNSRGSEREEEVEAGLINLVPRELSIQSISIDQFKEGNTVENEAWASLGTQTDADMPINGLLDFCL
jgi:hypothetical protein